MDTQLKRGLLEICVLASMLHEKTYGYKLIRDISPFIDISESTLYPILKRLESADLVTVESVEYNNRLRRYYNITDDGRERIQSFIKDWGSVMKVFEYIEGEFRNEKK